jgi:hypothetical protein
MLVPACASPPEPLSSAAIDPDHLKTLAWIKNLKIFLYLQDLLASALPLYHPPWRLQTPDKKCQDFKFRLTSNLGGHFFFSLGKERVQTKPSSASHPCRAPSAWCSPRWRYRVQVRYSGYTRLTTQPILRIRIPVFCLKTYFFHIFYQQRLSKTKKNNIKKTKCYEKNQN